MPEPEFSNEKKSGRSVNRVERILTILKVLQSGWFSQEELLNLHPEFSKRTFYRDLDDIRNYFGEAVQSNGKGELHFEPDGTVYFQSLDLTYMEALSVYLLCQMGKNSPNAIPYLDAVSSAMQKLRCLSHGLFTETMDYQLEHTGVELQPIAPQSNHSFFSDLLYAQEKRNAVLIEYDSIYDKQVIQTLIQPYFIHFTRHAWYVTGRSGFHHEIRTFHLERIRSLKIIHDSSYTIPGGWNYESFRGNAWVMIRDGEDVDVFLRFTQKVARNVASVKWHKTQFFRFNPDGTLDFHVRVAEIHEISWWILGYGDQVEVLAPLSLRNLIHEKAEAMLKIYEQKTDSKKIP